MRRTITLQNSDQALSDADMVVLTDSIPAPFVALEVDNTDCTLNGNDLECTWEHIPADSGPIEINVKVSVPADADPDTLTNTAFLSSDEQKVDDSVDVEIIEESSITEANSRALMVCSTVSYRHSV